MRLTTVVPRKGINDDGLGKKHALFQLISAADTDYVWLQDDDIIPPTATPDTDADLLILPLRMEGGDTLIERLQKAEYAAIQQLTIESALKGHPVLCSGANMIVRRDRWLESFNDLHPEIPSGDDMFLLESFKRRGLRIEVSDRPEYTATIHALTSFSALMRQRMRWAGKAPHYTDQEIRRCGTIVIGANILQLLCPLIILIKFPIEYRLIKKRDASVSLLDAFLLEIVYPIYMLICIIGGLFRKQW